MYIPYYHSDKCGSGTEVENGVDAFYGNFWLLIRSPTMARQVLALYAANILQNLKLRFCCRS